MRFEWFQTLEEWWYWGIMFGCVHWSVPHPPIGRSPTHTHTYEWMNEWMYITLTYTYLSNLVQISEAIHTARTDISLPGGRRHGRIFKGQARRHMLRNENVVLLHTGRESESKSIIGFIYSKWITERQQVGGDGGEGGGGESKRIIGVLLTRKTSSYLGLIKRHTQRWHIPRACARW